MERDIPQKMSTSDDSVLNAEVEHAIDPYRSLLPPEMLEVLRASLVQAYLEHPAGQQILDHLRQQERRINESRELLIDQDQDASPAPPVIQLSASGIQRKSVR